MDPIDKILEKGLNLQKGNRVLVLFDQEKWEIAEEMIEKCKSLETRVESREIAVSQEPFFEPPRELITPFISQDVVISVTTNDLTLSKAVRKARGKGTRIVNMANIDRDLFYSLDVDYRELKEKGSKIRKKLKKGQEARLTTEEGTDLSFELGEKREIKVESGLCRSKGDVCTYPAGEVSFCPLEETINGEIVVTEIRGDENPFKLTYEVEDGEILNPGELKTDKVGEIGLGLNPEIKLKGRFPHDLKKQGTAHVGIGGNFYLGGEIWEEKHYDLSVGKATIKVDGVEIDF